ncbi:unnamed protein product [Rotaria magnacalcarata]
MHAKKNNEEKKQWKQHTDGCYSSGECIKQRTELGRKYLYLYLSYLCLVNYLLLIVVVLMFTLNAICSLVCNPIEHHRFTCSTMPVSVS